MVRWWRGHLIVASAIRGNAVNWHTCSSVHSLVLVSSIRIGGAGRVVQTKLDAWLLSRLLGAVQKRLFHLRRKTNDACDAVLVGESLERQELVEDQEVVEAFWSNRQKTL